MPLWCLSSINGRDYDRIERFSDVYLVIVFQSLFMRLQGNITNDTRKLSDAMNLPKYWVS